MELRRFRTLNEAEAWYQGRLPDRGGETDAIFLALCRGEDETAQSLYRQTEFPSRWWADITYMQGHYLIRLRRRDRLIELARSLNIDIGPGTVSDDPWKDLNSIAQAIDGLERAAPTDSHKAVLACLLGHAYLAMDFHEAANTAYLSAIRLDRSVRIPWENMRLLEFVCEERPPTESETVS